MKEIRRMLEVYGTVDFTQHKAALATVVRVEGSAYRRPGARLLITDDGRWEGAISGGELEGDALHKARQVMLNNIPRLVTYNTSENGANSLALDLGCDGVIDVLIEPIHPSDPNNPILLLKDFFDKRDLRITATVIRTHGTTTVATGHRFIGLEDSKISVFPKWLLSDVARVIMTGKPITNLYQLAEGSVEVFIERPDPGIDLVIFGAGYEAIPVAALAKTMGWQVTVTEDCVAHLTPRRFPAADVMVYADRHDILQKITFTDRTAAVLMSHNFSYDVAVLSTLLTTNVPYIGILGSRTRYEKMQEAFTKSGSTFAESALRRIHTPIGIDMGAETPDEIALSIIAEIKAFFAKRPGGFLKDKQGPIHERARTPQSVAATHPIP